MSSQDEHPACTEVFSDDRLRRVCQIFCCCYRKERAANDDRHCTRQLLALDGELGKCVRTRSNLKDSILWVDQNKGATL